MQVHLLGETDTVLNQFIAEIRDKEIQKDPLRFRKNMERIGQTMAYELSRSLVYTEKVVVTPLGNKTMRVVAQQPVIASILRAGLTLHHGVLDVFDRAENAFISAYRKNISQYEFDIHVEYLACPDLTGKTLIIVDPMLATGRSMLMVYKAILQNGTPAKVHVISVIASTKGLEHLKSGMPENTEIWLAGVDPDLDAKSYIIPGLGDAGDLAFGDKL
jgi:uracil phosphoribosyltransferase